MTFRPAMAEDAAALTAFLRRHEASSMFLLANLLGTGLPSEFWLGEDDRGVSGALALTASGMALIQHPAPAAARRALAGRRISGILGPAEQVAALRRALGLADAPTRHDAAEPGYGLELDALALPDCTGFALHPLAPEDLPALVAWRAAYEQELFALPAEQAESVARQTLQHWLAADSHRLLRHHGSPVALTGINARLPDAVQIGAVYVPPALRGRGFARRAVALHLAELRQAGIRRACLFAASPAAEAAYRAIGFARLPHEIGLTLFTAAQQVPE